MSISGATELLDGQTPTAAAAIGIITVDGYTFIMKSVLQCLY